MISFTKIQLTHTFFQKVYMSRCPLENSKRRMIEIIFVYSTPWQKHYSGLRRPQPVSQTFIIQGPVLLVFLIIC